MRIAEEKDEAQFVLLERYYIVVQRYVRTCANEICFSILRECMGVISEQWISMRRGGAMRRRRSRAHLRQLKHWRYRRFCLITVLNRAFRPLILMRIRGVPGAWRGPSRTQKHSLQTDRRRVPRAKIQSEWNLEKGGLERDCFENKIEKKVEKVRTELFNWIRFVFSVKTFTNNSAPRIVSHEFFFFFFFYLYSREESFNETPSVCSRFVKGRGRDCWNRSANHSNDSFRLQFRASFAHPTTLTHWQTTGNRLLHSGRTRTGVTMTLVKRETRSSAGERVRINYTSDCRACNLVAFVHRKFASN